VPSGREVWMRVRARRSMEMVCSHLLRQRTSRRHSGRNWTPDDGECGEGSGDVTTLRWYVWWWLRTVRLHFSKMRLSVSGSMYFNAHYGPHDQLAKASGLVVASMCPVVLHWAPVNTSTPSAPLKMAAGFQNGDTAFASSQLVLLPNITHGIRSNFIS